MNLKWITLRFRALMAHAHEEQTRPLEEQKAAEAKGYEFLETPLKPAVWLVGITIGLIVLTYIVTEGVFEIHRLYAKTLKTPVTMKKEMRKMPPAPVLQTDDGVQDLADMRHENAAVLNTYGWVDNSRQKVRLPIERAMELTVNEAAR
jgi:hypothetical protein